MYGDNLIFVVASFLFVVFSLLNNVLQFFMSKSLKKKISLVASAENEQEDPAEGVGGEEQEEAQKQELATLVELLCSSSFQLALAKLKEKVKKDVDS